MVCSRCLKVIKQELQELGITVLSLELGKLLVEAPDLSKAQINQEVTQVLHANGFEIVKSEEDMLVVIFFNVLPIGSPKLWVNKG